MRLNYDNMIMALALLRKTKIKELGLQIVVRKTFYSDFEPLIVFFRLLISILCFRSAKVT